MSFFKLTPNYTDAELKTEWKRLVKLHHPDLGGVQATFVAVNQEFELLKARKIPQSPPRADPPHNKPQPKEKYKTHNIPPYGDVLYFPRSFAGAGYGAGVYDVYLPGIAFEKGCVVDFGSTKIRIKPGSTEGEFNLGPKTIYFWLDPSDK